jgi:hypothetical protein
MLKGMNLGGCVGDGSYAVVEGLLSSDVRVVSQLQIRSDRDPR